MPKQPHREFRGYRTAGIRLTEEVLPGLGAHRGDRAMAMLYAVHWFDKAHLVMMAEEGLIPREAASSMLVTLLDIEREGMEQARRAAGGGMHSGEHLLIQRLGEEVGGHLHLARSSADLGAVGLRILQRDRLLEIMTELNALRGALLDVSEAHVDTIMPGYTQGQHAQPTTLAHQLTAWGAVMERDFERAVELYRRVNVSPAGAANMTGSDFTVNRQRTSDLLGFDRPISNTFDAVTSHDVLLESLWVLTILNADLSRWADDILLWDTSEFGFVDIPDRFCGTSSILMQAKNPYAPEYLKGVGAVAVGALMTGLLVERGPTGLAVLDRQPVTEALARLQEDTVRDLRWWWQLLSSIRWKEDRMEELAGRFWGQATDIAGALVREKGIPWRTAHQIVGILVRYCDERDIPPSEATSQLLDEAAIEYQGAAVDLSSEALRSALDPRHFVMARDVLGGPAPAPVTSQVRDLRSRLLADGTWVQKAEQSITDAKAQLKASIDALVGGGGA